MVAETCGLGSEIAILTGHAGAATRCGSPAQMCPKKWFAPSRAVGTRARFAGPCWMQLPLSIGAALGCVLFEGAQAGQSGSPLQSFGRRLNLAGSGFATKLTSNRE